MEAEEKDDDSGGALDLFVGLLMMVGQIFGALFDN
jgi:hypothetical protein